MRDKLTLPVIFIVIILCFVFVLGYFMSSSKGFVTIMKPKIKRKEHLEQSTWLKNTQDLSFTHENVPLPFANKSWRILWYNCPSYLVSAVKNFDQAKCKNVLSKCILSTNIKQLDVSDIVIFTHAYLPRSPPKKLESQIWCFNTMENKAFTHHPSDDWKDKFEWIMSYRRDADIVRPYGKIIRRKQKIYKNYTTVIEHKSKFSVWMSSHCPVPSRRKAYIEELQKYIEVDTFGTCGKKMCVNGPREAAEYLPKETFLSAMNFSSPKDLAETLKTIGSNESLYLEYLKKKDDYFALDQTTMFRDAMCDTCKMMEQLNGRKPHTKANFFDTYFKNDC
uniref:Fucosyltransferase n=1 Tax=Crassostrea virginica TaxID=6565 RepID=A0A8B8AMQ3_CRAVI|nr:glycoprotein 3-alpha-L-fucosyltransferase A-like isoform X2 [Crassostrea virginica]